MANYVTNHIKVHGNKQAKAGWLRILEAFENYQPKPAENQYQDNSVYAIPEILFGESDGDQDKAWFEQYAGAKWVKPDHVNEDVLVLTSAWSAVFPLIQHLVELLAKRDPDVVVTLYYEDECPLFVGCSVGLMHEGEVKLMGDEEDTSNILVVYSREELDEYEADPEESLDAELIKDIVKRIKEETREQLEFLPKKRFNQVKKIVKQI